MVERKYSISEVPKISEFLLFDNETIAEVVKATSHPKNVALMIDGTRRLLKLEPDHHDDTWLYGRNHIDALMAKSVQVTDILFNMGVEVVTAPLVSYGNLFREGFVPEGLERLLQPLLEEETSSVLSRHRATVNFYGDLALVRSIPSGSVVNQYLAYFEKANSKIVDPRKKILIGLGFTTDRETTIISHKAIDYFRRTGKYPTQAELVEEYFGIDVPPVDIFIRTNELKTSGGLTPLLTQQDTQFYFPSSPGLISLSETNLRRIMFDYLFNRNISGGRHQHQPITVEQAIIVRDFYHDSINHIAGIGRRVADIWIHDPE